MIIKSKASNIDQVLPDLKKLTEDILSFFESSSDVEVISNEENSIQINIDDPELNKLLLAKDGKVLNSLQSLIISSSRTRWPNLDLIIHLDIAGYRAAQAKELLDGVDQLAKQVLESEQEQILTNLNSLERRLIHKFIADKYCDKLTTISSGDSRERILTIQPAGQTKSSNS